jgi:hypothetical protein
MFVCAVIYLRYSSKLVPAAKLPVLPQKGQNGGVGRLEPGIWAKMARF